MAGGKIICVVGAPRTGKSTLVKKLAEHYGATALYEVDGDFPDRIKEDVMKNIRPLERALWFRNRLVGQYMKALDIKSAGGMVVFDTAYFIDVYTDTLTSDVFEREVLHALALSDIKMFGFPDTVVHLTSNEEKIKEFIKLGGRELDAGVNYYAEYVAPIQDAWAAYLKESVDPALVVTIDRAVLDFEKPEDFQKVLDRIEGRAI
jgi:deoxyadenosine/deoxycytidine kinase